MESNANSNQKPILARIADRLIKDQEELDMLAVQLSLGKLEVKEQFEAAKKKLKNSVHEFKIEVVEEYLHTKKDARDSLKLKLDNLESKLEETKTDTKELFEAQRQNIFKAMEEVKNEIVHDPDLLKMANFFTSASEKAKLQFEIFEKKWDNTKEELAESFQDEMKTAKFKISDIIQKAKDKKEDIDDKLGDFSAEIHEAYSHLKKAVKSL